MHHLCHAGVGRNTDVHKLTGPVYSETGHQDAGEEFLSPEDVMDRRERSKHAFLPAHALHFSPRTHECTPPL